MFKVVKGGITAPKGYKASGIACGVKKSGKKDLALIFSEEPAKVASLFSTNRVKAAPILVSQEILKKYQTIRAVVVNSGNANACTGKDGLSKAKEMVNLVSNLLKLPYPNVLVASTGIIGEPLPIDKIRRGIKKAVKNLSKEGSSDAAKAIMTTDTFPKEIAIEFKIDNQKVRIGGMAKGAGMIAPYMATTLSFFTTDALIETSFLRQTFQTAIDKSFNSITVDGDMSTNDMSVILANGKAGNQEIKSNSLWAKVFKEALEFTTSELAKMIIQDGEGATKFIQIEVRRANSIKEARKVGFKIANSPLVKTAFFGEDPNWGRIMGAIGSAGVPINPEKIDILIDTLLLVKNGVKANFNQKEAKKIFKKKRINLIIDLKRGKEGTVIYTTDLSYEYVKINSAYRT